MANIGNQSSLRSDELWLSIIKEGIEDRVEVNQRMLIDKMLARYSSDFVVYRELIQNSDDAQATSFTLHLTCDPSTKSEIVNYVDQRPIHSTLSNIGKLLKNSLKSNLFDRHSLVKQDETCTNRISDIENELNQCLITEIRTENNGHLFNDDDWKRVITIAEGNTNVDAIGQFGVGFFSVFSYSERPMIQSGKYCLAFTWQNGKTLTTFRKELPIDQQTLLTSIVLPLKNQLIIQTNNYTMINDGKATMDGPVKSKKNIATNQIVATLNLNELKAFFTKVLSFTTHLTELNIKLNHQTIFHVMKTRKLVTSNRLAMAVKRLNMNNEYNLLNFTSFEHTEQLFSIMNGSSITLDHINVKAKVTIDPEFHQQIQGVLKKNLPSFINVQLLFPSNTIFDQILNRSSSEHKILDDPFLSTLIPIHYHDGEIISNGQIFIGLATSQSTGIGIHVFSHLIPTIERENIDLQDPYISIWNEQLLVSIGKIVRLLYDQTILTLVHQESERFKQNLISNLSPFAFQSSAPNPNIGRLLLDGFFSLDNDILVPVKRTPTDRHLSLIPSTEAYLTNSKYIESFLPIPIVPHDLSKILFLKTLQRYRLIQEIDYEIIRIKIHESILTIDEFVGLLHWLCTRELNHERSYIKTILSKIDYRERRDSLLIELKNIQYYDGLNIAYLPLPSNVLPSIIVAYLSRENLEKYLGLSMISMKQLLDYYLLETSRFLFSNEQTCRILLSCFAQHWTQLNQHELDHMKTILTNLPCIPTSQGLQYPRDSFIRSSNLNPNLALVQLYILNHPISDNDKSNSDIFNYPVSLEFLKLIGCRAIHLPAIDHGLIMDSTTNLSAAQSNSFQTFIFDLVQQRKQMSVNDLNALKQNECIVAFTLESSIDSRKKYKPSDVHFPSVAQRLNWKELIILDWLDIESHSPEYGFLKEIGVREVPDLHLLLLRIVEEHQQENKTVYDYQIPKALKFFIEMFQQHYSKGWKSAQIKIPFLPSISFETGEPSDVQLRTIETVFKDVGPLCAAILPSVLQYCSNYFDISLLGVKQRPMLQFAFELLMKQKDSRLNSESASTYFSYLGTLDGLNRTFIQNISNLAFIPLTRTQNLMKPWEVFIHSKSISSNETTMIDEIDTHGIIDYIDYGSEANGFLLNIGVRTYPTAEILASLLLERQANYFTCPKDSIDININRKLNAYTHCLKQLASIPNVGKCLNGQSLRNQLLQRPWCLAYQMIHKTDGNDERIFKIVRPSEVYLDDDHQSVIDLRPLCAPDEPELIKLYEMFGSKWLSECVHRILVHRGKLFETNRSKTLKELIHQRLDMLFVNNRGERLPDIDGKRIESLRSQFTVYETEAIQCQISFENKLISLNSTECSSCALEQHRQQVILSIRADLMTLDYIDIATELTRFVCKKPFTNAVHSISEKLSSPLETLKRRGIPVDRLLKIAPSQSSNDSIKITTSNHEQQTEEQLSQRVFRSIKDFLVNHRTNNDTAVSEQTRSTQIERNLVDDFGAYVKDHEHDISTMIQASRPYSEQSFQQQEHSQTEINNSCEHVPASNMILHSSYLHGIPLYIEQNVTLNSIIIEQAKQLAWLLRGLAINVFHIPVRTMHLFRDINSARIAFNTQGSLFFNVRYFEQAFANDLRPYIHRSSGEIPLIRTVVNFYFIVTCHELSHNLDNNHDLNFINHLERVSVHFMDAKDTFLSQFSFNGAL